MALTLAVVALVGGANAPAASAAQAQTITNEFGTLKVGKVTGEAKNGATFAGKYKLHRFITGKNGKTKAVGHLTGTLTKKNGNTRKVDERGVRLPLNVAATRTANLPVPPVLPTPSGTRSLSVVGCEVLNLVLGPLDLDLLGLVIHLDRVVLNITAVPGAGALLGNLLCAIVGILDGTPLGGLGGILTNLLNAVLGILRA